MNYISFAYKAVRSTTIRDSLISFSGQFTAAILGAVFFALVFRLLDERLFGVFSLAYATAVILKDLIDPAISTSLLRFVPGATWAKIKAYRSYALAVIIMYFAVVTPLMLLLSQWLSGLIFKELFLGLIPLIILTAFSLSVGNYLSAVMRSAKRFVAEAIFTVAQPVIRLILIGGLFWMGMTTVQAVLFVNLAAYLIIVVCFWIYLGLYISPFNINSQVRYQVNKFLSSMVLTSATGTVTDRANLYITNYLVNLSSVGILSAYAQLMRPVNQFVGSFDSVLGSRFAGFKTDQEARTYLFKAFGVSGLMIVGLLSSNLFMFWIIGAMYGAELVEHYRIFQLFTLAYSVYILYGPINAYLLYYKGRADIMAAAAVVQLLTTIIANWFFISRWGIYGAPLASLSVFSVMVVILGTSAYLAKVKPKDETNV